MSSAFPRAVGVWGVQTASSFSGNWTPVALAAPSMEPGTSTQADQLPWAVPDRIRWQERQQTQSISPIEAEQGWQLAAWQVPDLQVGIVERVATLLVVEALDGDGVTVQITRLDGQAPFFGSIAHPNPANGVLSVRWMLRAEDATERAVALAVSSGLPVAALPGLDLVPSWITDNYGWDCRFSDQLQVVVQCGTTLRLWVALSGEPDAWRVSATGRIGGFAQPRSGGGLAALASARTRS